MADRAPARGERPAHRPGPPRRGRPDRIRRLEKQSGRGVLHKPEAPAGAGRGPSPAPRTC